MKKIILFGSTSNIAIDLVNFYLRIDYEILLIGRKNIINKKNVYFCNLNNPDKINKKFIKADLSIYLIHDDSNNIKRNLSLLSKCLNLNKQLEIKKFIYLSSTHVYKTSSKISKYYINSDTDKHKYASVKINSESCVRQFSQNNKLDYIILRIPHVLTYNNDRLIILLKKLIMLGISVNNSKKNTYITTKFLYLIINHLNNKSLFNQIYLISEKMFLSLYDIQKQIMKNNNKELNKNILLSILIYNIFFKFIKNISKYKRFFINILFYSNIDINFDKKTYDKQKELDKIFSNYD